MLKLFALVLLAIEAVASSAAALTSFQFLRSECLQSNFSDFSTNHSVGNLAKINSNASCLDSNGIGGYQVQSLQNLATLFTMMNDKEFSFELWVQPQLENHNYFIVGYGNNNAYRSLQCRFNLLVRTESS